MFVQNLIEDTSRFTSCDVAMGIAKPANPMREEFLQTRRINLDIGRVVLQTKFLPKLDHLAGCDVLNVCLIGAGVGYTLITWFLFQKLGANNHSLSRWFHKVGLISHDVNVDHFGKRLCWAIPGSDAFQSNMVKTHSLDTGDSSGCHFQPSGHAFMALLQHPVSENFFRCPHIAQGSSFWCCCIHLVFKRLGAVSHPANSSVEW